MSDKEKFINTIEEAIKNIPYPGRPAELYEPVKYILSLGGKRLRPLFCLMSCKLFGGDPEKAITPAIGMEVFHNFTLVHDDIMDKADVRRGHDCIHVKWDENRAILSGDAMLLLANKLMLHVDDDVLRRVLTLYNDYGLLVCDGQQYDMNFESSDEVSIDDYIHMITLKTAALLAACLRLGAVIARASDDNIELITRFGENLGISFQIEDDILDSFGNYDKFGKKIGGDIREKKKTFLYLKALELADSKLKKELIHLYHSDDVDKTSKVIDIYKKLNIAEVARNESQKYFDLAIIELDKIMIEEEKKTELKQLAASLVNREF